MTRFEPHQRVHSHATQRSLANGHDKQKKFSQIAEALVGYVEKGTKQPFQHLLTL